MRNGEPVNGIADQLFFERHLEPWAARFFADLEIARSAEFYRNVGTLGRRVNATAHEKIATDFR